MPQRSGIRWTDAQIKQLQRDVRVFNTMLTKATKADPNIVQFLPPKLSVADLKRNIKTATQLKDVTAYVERAKKSGFNIVTTPGGVTDISFNLEELKRKIKNINKERAKRSKTLESNRRLGKAVEVELKPKREDVENIKAQNWSSFVESVEHQSDPNYWKWRYQRYKEGYLLALYNEFGGYPGYDELANYVKGIDPKVMWEKGVAHYATEIQFIYEHSVEAKARVIQEILNAWKSIT